MAVGCPVVTSDTSSLPEVAGDAAVLVDPYDASAIAKGLFEVCSDSTFRTEMASLGKKRAQQFSWNRCARQVADVYRKCV